VTFSYYDRLSASEQRVYRRSDEVPALRLRDPERLRPLVTTLADGLAKDDRAGVERVCQALLDGLAADFGVRRVRAKVLAVRPSRPGSELHGLYESHHGGEPATITVWMRTVRQRRVVAFRTFLRTLLHEVCHHLDFALLRLPESFHTRGFFQRESSLFRALVPEAAAPRRVGPEAEPELPLGRG
jgi:hypothetical protein